MPQASDELRAKFPGGDREAIDWLEGRGFTLTKEWNWIPPHDHPWWADTMPIGSEYDRDNDAVVYLITEWDFGGSWDVMSRNCCRPMLFGDIYPDLPAGERVRELR